jgi:hypothetical protein
MTYHTSHHFFVIVVVIQTDKLDKISARAVVVNRVLPDNALCDDHTKASGALQQLFWF